MGPEGLQLVKYIEAIGCPTGLLHIRHPHGVPFLFRSHDQSARLPGFRNVRLVVHQKLETGSIAYALDLAGWALLG